VRYALTINTSDGGRRLVLVKMRTAKMGGVPKFLHSTVSISGLLINNVAGKAGTAKFKGKH
jgi:hypothetical protein